MAKERLSKDEVEHILSIITRQFIINTDKNIFLADDCLCFSDEMTHSLNVERRLWSGISAGQWEIISEYLVHKFLHCFYNTNQYLNFELKDYIHIHKLYDELLKDISEGKTVQKIEEIHYERLRVLVAGLQPVLYEKCSAGKMNKYVCSEYSAKFQLALLQLKPSEIKEPLLDIGCGEHGYLVKELRKQGITAYGIDRLCQTSDGLIQSSWFDFDFGEKKWGTIVSNLSFSSHYINHIVNNSVEVQKFNNVYHDILNSLVPGGVWHYAPALPQLEANLSNEFIVVHSKIDDVFSKTMILRKADK